MIGRVAHPYHVRVGHIQIVKIQSQEALRHG
jgi:hypothetical protein